MTGKRSSAAHFVAHASASVREHFAAVASGPQESVASAMDALLSGYREEAEIYLHMLQLTWRQRDILRNGLDLSLFRDLLEEKEALLRMIGQIDTEMKSAKSLVLSYPPSQSPNRRELEKLLDRLTERIEEIRRAESNNAGLLDGIPEAN